MHSQDRACHPGGVTHPGMKTSAHDLIERFLDRDTFQSWDRSPVAVTTTPTYAAALDRARTTAGTDEAVITGQGLLRGRPVAVIAGEFAFLGGSIGVAAAERLVLAVERAAAQRLPLLASPISGGTRMQEGTVAFLQMVKIADAITAFKAAGLPYLVYLRNPTTGGVFASWGSLGHVTVAEPGALIGFLGPRVYEALYHRPFPSGVQTAENLYAHGLLDAVLAPAELGAIADRVLNVLLAPRVRPAGGTADPKPLDQAATNPTSKNPASTNPGATDPGATDPTPARATPTTAWDSVTASRRRQRPGIRRLLRTAATDVTPLNGTGTGEVDPGILLALARFGGAPCVVLGQDRLGQQNTPMGPAALREARRGMHLAAELRVPLVTVIDTPGAALSKEAEEGGMAGEIARSLAQLVTLEAPTICLLLGQGSGGGALALAPADRVIAARHGWLSPLPPEGASVIVHRDTEHAAQMATDQKIASWDLFDAGIVDRIVDERPDATDEPAAFCRRVGDVLADELYLLLAVPAEQRLAARHRRYRTLGLPAP